MFPTRHRLANRPRFAARTVILLTCLWPNDAIAGGAPQSQYPYQPSDLNQDCKVNGLDASILLGVWNP